MLRLFRLRQASYPALNASASLKCLPPQRLEGLFPSYPALNASASLKCRIVDGTRPLDHCYPALNASASLKCVLADELAVVAGPLSGA